jgi:hypothetical protein
MRSFIGNITKNISNLFLKVDNIFSLLDTLFYYQCIDDAAVVNLVMSNKILELAITVISQVFNKKFVN